jgi:hypothetical protein
MVLEGHDKKAGYLDAVDWLTIDNSKRLQLENESLRVKKSEYEELRQRDISNTSHMTELEKRLDDLSKEYAWSALYQTILLQKKGEILADMDPEEAAAVGEQLVELVKGRIVQLPPIDALRLIKSKLTSNK